MRERSIEEIKFKVEDSETQAKFKLREREHHAEN